MDGEGTKRRSAGLKAGLGGDLTAQGVPRGGRLQEEGTPRGVSSLSASSRAWAEERGLGGGGKEAERQD